jgi:hypothetical protein
MAELPRLTTADLITQYNRADAKRGARHNAETGIKTRLQVRIDTIVDLLADRAEAGDELAEAWLRG